MTIASRMALAAAVLFGSVVGASADTITAVGQGWCTVAMCNSSSLVGLKNTFAGSHESGSSHVEYRDWFAFDIPAAGDITSATLNVWNEAANDSGRAGATFELRNASSRSFAGLAGAVSLGSVSVDDADVGTAYFVGITLNDAALALLNGSRGSRFLFGGVVTPFNAGREVQIFGFGQGPPAAFLDINTEAAAVPEPSTVVLVVTGGLAFAASRTRRAAAARLRAR